MTEMEILQKANDTVTMLDKPIYEIKVAGVTTEWTKDYAVAEEAFRASKSIHKRMFRITGSEKERIK